MSTSYFSKASADNAVLRTESMFTVDLLDVYGPLQEIVADDTYQDNEGSKWIRTWYQANGDPAKRFNYAGQGYTFDPTKGTKGAFIAPQPFPSWSLDAQCKWQAPIPYPNDGRGYNWDEAQRQWVVS